MALFGDWGKVPGFFMLMQQRVHQAGVKANRNLAYKSKKIWRDGIRTRSFNLIENAPATIAKKQSSVPLEDNKDMVNSINVQQQGDDYFVGINRMAKNRDGTELYNLAIVHEYGVMYSVGRSGGGRVKIPARPHRHKTIEAVGKIYEKEVTGPILDALK
jgi:hypothetical protein